MSPRRLVLCLAVAAVSVACSGSNTSPQRPSGVPNDALWVGGADGGVFVLVKPPPGGTEGAYSARIYAEGTGDILFDGRLVLDPPGGPPPDLGNPRGLGGWDGDALYLADGRALRAEGRAEE